MGFHKQGITPAWLIRHSAGYLIVLLWDWRCFVWSHLLLSLSLHPLVLCVYSTVFVRTRPLGIEIGWHPDISNLQALCKTGFLYEDGIDSPLMPALTEDHPAHQASQQQQVLTTTAICRWCQTSVAFSLLRPWARIPIYSWLDPDHAWAQSQHAQECRSTPHHWSLLRALRGSCTDWCN